MRKSILSVAFSAALLAGCIVTTPVSLLYNGAKLAGKTVYYTGKGVYKVGELTVRTADGVLDGSDDRLKLVILMAEKDGSTSTVTREIDAEDLNTQLAELSEQKGVKEVRVEKV